MGPLGSKTHGQMRDPLLINLFGQDEWIFLPFLKQKKKILANNIMWPSWLIKPFSLLALYEMKSGH